ncbi:replicative DNA helicase [Xanthomonas arboricola pv. corylina]|nr:replicative DNA helicase [Xanthomonas arboricola]PPU15828.1 replicative DNA helicase [Xanthomonas arboricola pv. corylina]
MSARPGFFEEERSFLRVPPHSVDSEQSVLGGLMLAPEALLDVKEILGEEDFYRRDHQLIYRAILELAQRERPFDVVTLGEWFESQGKQDQVRDGAYLIELASTVPSAANIRAYAQIVRNKSLLRQLITDSTEIVNEAFGASDHDAEELVSASAAKLASLTVKSSGAGGLVLMRGVQQGAWSELEDRFHGAGDMGLPPPWDSVRSKLPGLEDTDLMVLAARPSMGKTAKALQWASHAAALGRNVAVFSLEMSRNQLVSRLWSARSGVDQTRMRERGGLTNEDWAALSEARNYFHGLPLAIDDCGSLPVDSMRARAARMHAKVDGGLGLVVIDYLQLMTGQARHDNRTEEVSYISRSLKGLAKQLKCPVIALSQLNRSVESRTDKRPVMSDLRESGAIEQDADVIAFLYRDDYYRGDACAAPGISELIIAKNRQGATGTAYLRHRLEISTFESYHGPKPQYVLGKGGSESADDGFDDPTPRGNRRSRKDAAAGDDR